MKDFSKLIKNLNHLGYTVREFSTAKEASLYLTESIQNCSVGFGGYVKSDSKIGWSSTADICQGYVQFFLQK